MSKRYYKTTICRVDGKVDSNGNILSDINLMEACVRAIGSSLCKGFTLIEVVEEGVFINAIFVTEVEECLQDKFVVFGFNCKVDDNKVCTVVEGSIMSMNGLTDNHSDEGAIPLTLI